MIEAQNLTKRFGDLTAVEDVSFRVEAGEVVGFLGPNGAGKTTTMRVLTCFLPASSGSARVAGFDIYRDPLKVRRSVGYLPESIPLYGELRVVEYLRYRADLKGVPLRRRRAEVDRVVGACTLDPVRRQIIATLSRGFRQRVGLADAMLGEPKLLILDEPTIGLDPHQVRQVRGLIKEISRGQTVLLSTHILPEVEMMCDRVIIVHEGRIVRADRLKNLTHGSGLHVEIEGPPPAVCAALRGLPGVRGVEGEGPAFTLQVEENLDVREAVFRRVVEGGWILRELRSAVTPLEETFIRITGDVPGGEGPV